MNLVDDSFVTQKTVGGMLVYLMLLCFFLGYCLITFWPSPAPLIVSSIEPNNGQPGNAVTISGSGFTTGVTSSASGFTTGMTVSFDNPDPTGTPEIRGTIVKNDNTTIEVNLPERKPGKARVTVMDQYGQTVVVPDGFEFIAKPPSPEVTPPTAPPSNTTGTGATSPGGKAPSAPPNARPATNAKAPDAKTPAAPTPASPAQSKEYRSIAGTNLTPFTFLFVFHFQLRQYVQILLVVMIVGALGGLMHVFRSFYWYVGNRTLKNSWLLMYFLLPFNGAGLAVLFYLIVRGGFSSQTSATPSSVDWYAAMAALVGMFSEEALLKLRQIAGAFFTQAEPGKDPAISTLKISALTPKVGPIAGGTPVKITGTGFAPGDQVMFGGATATAISITNSKELSATTPAHPLGVVDVVVSNSAGQSSTLPDGFTYQ
jgi:hypothetical protein